jgi:hypothetical protein
MDAAVPLYLLHHFEKYKFLVAFLNLQQSITARFVYKTDNIKAYVTSKRTLYA